MSDPKSPAAFRFTEKDFAICTPESHYVAFKANALLDAHLASLPVVDVRQNSSDGYWIAFEHPHGGDSAGPDGKPWTTHTARLWDVREIEKPAPQCEHESLSEYTASWGTDENGKRVGTRAPFTGTCAKCGVRLRAKWEPLVMFMWANYEAYSTHRTEVLAQVLHM